MPKRRHTWLTREICHEGPDPRLPGAAVVRGRVPAAGAAAAGGGGDPEKYRAMYDTAEGESSQEKINSLRRADYAEHREEINAQKRAAYAARKITENVGVTMMCDSK